MRKADRLLHVLQLTPNAWRHSAPPHMLSSQPLEVADDPRNAQQNKKLMMRMKGLCR